VITELWAKFKFKAQDQRLMLELMRGLSCCAKYIGYGDQNPTSSGMLFLSQNNKDLAKF
jgi:hypothetical protein